MSMLETIKIHPAASLFPMISDADLQRLADDIALNGQIHPIVFCGDELIDGRNRFRACEIARIEPRIEQKEFASEGAKLDYIIAVNEHRRHLDTSQRAMIAAQISEMRGGATAVSQEAAAKALNVSKRSVASAAKVSKASPELAKKVKEGSVSVAAAERLVDSPDTAKKVAAGEIGAKEATRELRERAKKAKAEKTEKDEKKGEKAKPASDEKPKKEESEKPASDKVKAENAALKEKVDELEARLEQTGISLKETTELLAALQKIMDADDKASEYAKQVKALREQLGAAKSRIDGLMREKNVAVQEARAARRTIDRMQKEKEVRGK